MEESKKTPPPQTCYCSVCNKEQSGTVITEDTTIKFQCTGCEGTFQIIEQEQPGTYQPMVKFQFPGDIMRK